MCAPAPMQASRVQQAVHCIARCALLCSALSTLQRSPLPRFKLAASCGLAEPNAMSLATSTPDGRVSVRPAGPGLCLPGTGAAAVGCPPPLV